MYGKYFTYDEKDSQTLGLTIAGLEQNDDITFGLSREVFQSSLNRYRNRVGHMGTRWQDVLSFNIQFIKDPCESSQSKMFFSEDEVNEINAWLTSPDYPKLFHMYDYDFERDSSESMILISMTSDESIAVQAHGYYPVTYTISGSTVVGNVDNTPQYNNQGERLNLKTPPILGMIYKYNGYYALSINDDDFISAVDALSVNNTDYSNVKTNFWLGSYASGQPLVNSYTVLINTEKVLNNKYDYYGVFSDIQPQVINGDVAGFTATFTTDSPFAWTHEITKTITNGSISFGVNSAERYREVYPIIQVTSTESQPPLRSDFRLTFTHENGESHSIDLSLRTDDTTTIDSGRSIIKDHSGLVSFSDLGITDADYIYWPSLKNGTNTVILTGTGTATITYREPRKVGDY